MKRIGDDVVIYSCAAQISILIKKPYSLLGAAAAAVFESCRGYSAEKCRTNNESNIGRHEEGQQQYLMGKNLLFNSLYLLNIATSKST
jgi:hypothetical protein